MAAMLTNIKSAYIKTLENIEIKDFPRTDFRSLSCKWRFEGQVEMRTRKGNFEIVPLSKIAPLLAAKQTANGINHSYSSRILSVSCDESPGRMREMLFSSAGYRVCSVLSTSAAVKQSESGVFDLIVIGHSSPLNERRFLLHELRGPVHHAHSGFVPPGRGSHGRCRPRF